jgi:hypothetical protein
MCVEKTRAYVKNNKKKLINGIVGWGRPVYTGEENIPLLNKLASTPTPVKAASPDAAKKAAKPSAKKSSGGGGGKTNKVAL